MLRAVDLDLDVVRGPTGRVWVDDEDEFADHRVRFGYPEEVARLRDGLLRPGARGRRRRPAPYDGCARAWLAQPADADRSPLGRPRRPRTRRAARRAARPVRTRSGPTRRGPASRLSTRRASRLSGCATYSPRITPDGDRDRDRGGGGHRQQPARRRGAALPEQRQAAVDREAGQHRHHRRDHDDQRRHPHPPGRPCS